MRISRVYYGLGVPSAIFATPQQRPLSDYEDVAGALAGVANVMTGGHDVPT
jgi:hypothetical protein